LDNFRNYITQFGILTTDEFDLLVSYVQEETVKKGSLFLNYNQVSRKLGWVQSGVFRYIHLSDDGIEHTKYFVSENQFISGVESFTNQTASPDAIEALTDASIFTLSYENYAKLFDAIPNWGKLVSAITQYAYTIKMKEISPLVMMDARTRYENFLATQPQVMQRVSLGTIASYLGITQQSLSRLRKELARG
jgi:CRP-like cAMP-binding protein